MVIRAWLVVGILLIGVAWYLTVIASPPALQGSAQTEIDAYRQAGLMPAAGALKQSTAISHDVFELPAADAEHLKEAEAAQTVSMPGMNMDMTQGGQGGAMPGMNVSDAPQGAGGATPGMNVQPAAPHAAAEGQEGAMKGMAMEQPGEQQAMPMPQATASAAKQPMQMGTGEMKPQGGQPMQMESARTEQGHVEPSEPMKGMAMERPAQQQAMPMQGMDMSKAGPADEHPEEPMHMEKDGHGEEEAAGGHHGGGGIDLVAAGSAMPVDRTIKIEMKEWGYTPNQVTVKAGEVVRLIVTNAGNIPHEFMIMTGPGMASVGYRNQRADWNLTEHEAIYENPLVMPGDTFETRLKIEQPGTWMFMCMFPYHMQMGMMGMMMTEGASGMNMGGMKM